MIVADHNGGNFAVCWGGETMVHLWSDIKGHCLMSYAAGAAGIPGHYWQREMDVCSTQDVCEKSAHTHKE